ncbi:hypothetical protein [Saccharospirillum alexandrii]|uniref:hypothetical protein n=1 Tax=Saccharospirillum alexandrii TaxID=2448477 RepID=UPI000FDB1554|nr:hypothetical protein [Saccharospirillum alexandrii]
MAMVQTTSNRPFRVSEDTLLAQTNDLIVQGFELQDMQSLDELERWDDAVNDILTIINDQVLNAGLASSALKRRIECLLELYVSVLASLSELQQSRTAQATELRQQRRIIAGPASG